MKLLRLPWKESFLKSRLHLANESDAFRDPACIVCGHSYHGDHQPVRINACGHILGRTYLMQVVEKLPIGDQCIVCRARLYRPQLRAMLEYFIRYVLRLLIGILEHIWRVVWRVYQEYK